MQISPRKLDEKLESYMSDILLASFTHCRTEDSVNYFLQDILTDTERIVVSKRLAIALLLLQNYGYYQICSVLKVSPPTVSKVKQWLKLRGDGFRTVLEAVKDDERMGEFWERVEAIVGDETSV